MTKEEIIEFCEMKAELEAENEDIYETIINGLEQEPDTWSLEDAREDFMDDVYNTLDFLPTNDEANQIIDSFNRVTSSIRREPCEDCISREAALEQAMDYGSKTFLIPANSIKALPSVTPKAELEKQEPAEWIVDTDDSRRWDRVRFYCSSCNDWNTYGKSKYCPNCGARMEESEGI